MGRSTARPLRESDLISLVRKGVAFHAFEIAIPDALVEIVADAQLPRGWDAAAIPGATRELGSTWARERRSVALSVPSIVVRQERNVLLNPLHPGFGKLAIARPIRFSFDERLLRVSSRPPRRMGGAPNVSARPLGSAPEDTRWWAPGSASP